MRRFVTASVFPTLMVLAFTGCSGKTSDNEADATASSTPAAKPVQMSSELDKFMNRPINPAEDGVVNFDERSGDGGANTRQDDQNAK
ncbi:hypothetical protein MRBLMA1_002401 [Sphingobium sp. LMA1-1-1.1]|uniref:hypothetical protein n=1 Tax=Sphingobium sp. LMA1-1-1.1 TaxID=3135238 RepID=UPI0034231CEA